MNGKERKQKGRKKEEMKRTKVFLTLIYIIGLSLVLSGCKQDASIKVLQEFIIKQVACETYKEAKGNEETLKQSFITFFTEESYQKYLDDVVGYMYPHLYYQTNADEVKIKSIVCKRVTKGANEFKTYTFDVSYQIIPLAEEGKKAKKIAMRDQMQITIDKKNKITNVVLLNTSDIIAKLFLDIKVQ